MKKESFIVRIWHNTTYFPFRWTNHMHQVLLNCVRQQSAIWSVEQQLNRFLLTNTIGTIENIQNRSERKKRGNERKRAKTFALIIFISNWAQHVLVPNQLRLQQHFYAFSKTSFLLNVHLAIIICMWPCASKNAIS